MRFTDLSVPGTLYKTERELIMPEKKKTLDTEIINGGARHDRWFREQIAAAAKDADKPGADFVSHEEIGARWAKKREALLKKAN